MPVWTLMVASNPKMTRSACAGDAALFFTPRALSDEGDRSCAKFFAQGKSKSDWSDASPEQMVLTRYSIKAALTRLPGKPWVQNAFFMQFKITRETAGALEGCPKSVVSQFHGGWSQAILAILKKSSLELIPTAWGARVSPRFGPAILPSTKKLLPKDSCAKVITCIQRDPTDKMCANQRNWDWHNRIFPGLPRYTPQKTGPDTKALHSLHELQESLLLLLLLLLLLPPSSFLLPPSSSSSTI